MVVMLKDVHFNKEQMWDWNIDQDQPQQLIIEEEQIQKNKEEFKVAPSSPPRANSPVGSSKSVTRNITKT